MNVICVLYQYNDLPLAGHDTGLVHEDCVSKMRLISLVDLGTHESDQISYSVIKETLQVMLFLILV